MYVCIFTGTDEKAIIEVIRSHSNEQRQQIKIMFKTMYGKVSYESRGSNMRCRQIVVHVLVDKC